jgi:flagellar assembly protein FliH
MATVIRGGKATLGQTFSFEDVARRAQEIIGHAQAQAQTILAQAHSEAQRRGVEEQRAARARGLAEGRAEARAQARAAAVAEARQSISDLTTALATGWQQFEDQKRRLLAIAETGVIELALAIARRVCKTHVGQATEPACANARHLLDLAKNEGDLELHVHPAEAESLNEVARQFVEQTGHLAHVALIADEAVKPGGCTLRTRTGTLSVTIDEQIERIAAALLANTAASGGGSAAGEVQPS